MNNVVLRASVGFLTLSLASPSYAAVLLSLNRATFQASASALTSQTFDTLANGTLLTTLNGVSYASSVGTPVVTNSFLTSTAPNGLGRTGLGFFATTDVVTFTFANAISAFAIDINTFATAPGSYDVVLNNGDQVFSIFESFSGTSTGQFIGFTSDTPFTSVTLTSNSGSNAFTLDTLRYGLRSAVVGSVPEPSTWAMMLIGFGAIGFSLRRGRRVKALYQAA